MDRKLKSHLRLKKYLIVGIGPTQQVRNGKSSPVGEMYNTAESACGTSPLYAS